MIVITVHASSFDQAGKGEQGRASEQAIRNLKRKMQRELVFRAMKMSRFYEPPSVKKVRKAEESERRRRKLMRKKMMDN